MSVKNGARGALRKASVHRLSFLAPLVLIVITLSPFDASGQALPAGWTASDVGAPPAAGVAQYSNGTFTVAGAGDVAGTSDQFRFVYAQVTGDVEIRARVVSVEAVATWSRAGVMVRESLAANAAFGYMFLSAGSRSAFQTRPATGTVRQHTAEAAASAPYWVRLVRQGTTVTAWRSADGAAWTVAATMTLTTSTIYIGLAVASAEPARAATAVFDTVWLFRPVTLPGGWTASDVGAPPSAGSAQYSNGTFTEEGAGDTVATADQFHFVHAQVTGDIEIRARVISVEAVQPSSKAGVMVRESLAANAAFGYVFLTAGSSSAFQTRATTGAMRQQTAQAAASAPYWVRLVRQGATVTAWRSADGAAWTVAATMTLSTATIYIGLAVASADPAQAATGVFDTVWLFRPAPANQPPAVSLTAPANGSSYPAPASVTIAATASDTDGTVTSVEFYQGTTLVGSDTTSPYSATWSNVPAGTYWLTAAARDEDAGMTVSAARSITVTSPLLPRRAVFTASTNHNTSVDYYVLEIFPAGADPNGANAVAAQNLGKPPVVNGECDVDIQSLIQGLSPGTFFGVVTAFGPAGSARSAPSPSFLR
jgi:hypothetical protein